METVTLETIHKDLEYIKDNIDFLKHVMEEEYELSDWAKKELKKARETPEDKYIDLGDL